MGKPPLWKFSLYLVLVNKEKGMMPQTNIKIEQERFVMRHLVVDISVSLNPWWHTLDYIELRQTCDSHLSPCATSYNHIKPTFQRRKCIYMCVCYMVSCFHSHEVFFVLSIKDKGRKDPLLFWFIGAWHLPWKSKSL